MLGPMVNPTFPKKQMVGVFSLELARLYGYLYQKTDKKFAIVHSLDGYDEISLTGAFKSISNKGEEFFEPSDLSLNMHAPESLFGGDSISEAATIFMNVLSGKGTVAQNNAVIANAGFALYCTSQQSLKESVELAKESLVSGKALKTFNQLIKSPNTTVSIS